MRKNGLLLFCLILFSFGSFAASRPKSMKKVVRESLDFALKQSLNMAKSLRDNPGLLPRTIDRNGHLVTCSPSWWVSGFFPGELWYLYEYSGNDSLKVLARKFTNRVRSQQYTTDNHDVGFMVYCSFGNGYRLTLDPDYREVLHTAACSLMTRYNPKVGCIRSWDKASWNSQWKYPVIIDNMMNLELLMWAGHAFRDSSFIRVAESHANHTLKNHFRKDYSSYHVVSYDPQTGKVEKKNTAQGYSDQSAWARGQAWGLYGFTMMFRESGDSLYLNQAEHIANFIINHPRLPKDKIPYWDFDDPKIPNTYRDASAGAIICSALIELSRYVPRSERTKYLKVAEIQLRSLSSPNYRAQIGQNGNFILKHSVGNWPNHSEIDVPLSYADYYYVEALVRYRKLKGF